MTYPLDMTSTRRSAAVALAGVALLGLAACAPTAAPAGGASTSPGGSPASSPLPSETPSDAPHAVTIVIQGESLRVLGGDDALLTEIPYTASGASAVGVLTDLLGTPVTSSIPGNASCQAPTTSYDWGGFVLSDPGEVIAGPGALYSVSATAVATSAGVGLEGPNDVQVGTAAGTVLAGNPGVTFDDDGSGGGVLHLQTVDGGSGPDSWGVAGFVRGGTMEEIASPLYFYGDC